MLAYFTQLNETEKSSVIQMLKAFIQGRQDNKRTSIEQYNKELKESESAIERGEFHTHDQVVEMSKRWLNGQ
jgi:hypothetical protein